MNEVLELLADNVTNSSFFIDPIRLISTAVVVFILSALVISELVAMIKSDIIDASMDKRFSDYMSNHSSGFYLKNISFDKDYIIITDDFFNNIREHGKIYHKYNLSDARRDFLIEMGEEYNIIVCIKGGYCGMKLFKIIDLCKYDNLPVCRIIDYIFPSVNLVMVRRTLKDGSVIYYYQKDK